MFEKKQVLSPQLLQHQVLKSENFTADGSSGNTKDSPRALT